MNPVNELRRGVASYPQGMRWLAGHRRYFLLLLVPTVVAWGVFFGGIGLFFSHQETVFSWIFFSEPDSWWWLPLYYLGKLFVYIATLGVFAVASFLLLNVVSAPFYEIVSVAVEKDVNDGKVEEISLWASFLLIGEELKKALFILAVTIGLWLIPGVNLFSIFASAFLLGWDFCDYPLARRGWKFRRRLEFVIRDFWAVMGFGLWLMIPFVQVFLIPFAIVGGTLLNLRSQQRLRQS